MQQAQQQTQQMNPQNIQVKIPPTQQSLQQQQQPEINQVISEKIISLINN